MGLFDWFRERAPRKMTSLDLFREVYGNAPVNSGVSVTWKTALDVTTVLACCRVIAEGVAQIPWRVYKDDGTGRSLAVDHSAFELVYSRPNSFQTSFEFRETVMFHTVLTNNAYVFLNRVGSDRHVAELIPLEPSSVEVTQNPDRTLIYKVMGRDGQKKQVPSDLIWHIRGPSWNGWMGMDAVKLAREAIGLALATEKTHADFHKNGVKSSGVYAIEGSLSSDQQKALSNWISQNFTNQSPMILDRNAKWQPTQMTGVDAQHIETRKFQIEEICRTFRVMPIMVGHSDKASTYASAEQMFLAHVVHTLSPWYERLEQSANANLLSPADRKGGFYTKFTPNALMRGAAADRAAFYSKALGSSVSPAWMTPNEVRALEEMNRINGGDTLFVPQNSGTPTNG